MTHHQTPCAKKSSSLQRKWSAVSACSALPGKTQNIGHLVGEVLAARGACAGGLVWYYARPPVIGLEYEMDVRGAAREIVL